MQVMSDSITKDWVVPLVDQHAKATNADDAEVSEYLWNEVIFPNGGLREIKALNLLRSKILR
jgi:hypothetical protein